MSNYAQLYWLTRLDGFHKLFAILMVISMIIAIIYSIVSYIEDWKTNPSIFRCLLFTFLLSAILLTFMPTKNEMIFIWAGGKTMDYVQSDTSLQKIPYQTTKIISDYLDEKIKDIKK